MNNILRAFDEKKARYESFATSLKSLLNSLLLNDNISIHSLETRVKERNSLEKKLIKKDKYKSIDEVTDVIGVRIITHYADDVEKVASVVEREFLVDKNNSIDKRASLEPDRFGYLSLHYIASLNENRANLREHDGYKNLKAEIQIRTILQHAWAEIEHDIGYKSNTGLPDEIRRKFSRLAGLLEIADSEFLNIKNSIDTYKEEVSEKIKSGSGNIKIDKISLLEYIQECNQIISVFDVINEKTKIKFSPAQASEDYANYSDLAIRGLDFISVSTVDQLNKLVEDNINLAAARIISLERAFKDYYEKNEIPRISVIIFIIQSIIALKNSNEIEEKFAEQVMTMLPSSEVENFFEKIRVGLKENEIISL
ncbi:GTP pyrophosphokinase family protein [Serratia marcescens]|uniref:GTP pyrophosphokinase n=1 Tax=Serratia marcescens TaxID=615 RepID=UPI00374A80C2